MSTGEILYLAMVVFAMAAFMATLSFVAYGGRLKPRTHADRRHGKHAAAGAH
jgi:hypothetical protein